jgi:hypothetical protein
MWDPQDIKNISPTAIQKRIPFAHSITDISNFIGNFTLNPEIIPTTIRNKYIIQALIRELILLKKHIIMDSEFNLTPEILKYSTCDEESVLISMDSLQLPDVCTIVKDKESLCTVIQLHPVNRILRGICIVDYGLTEKQTIYLDPQKLIRVPTVAQQDLKVIFSLTNGQTSRDQSKPLIVAPSKFGLIIDTRDGDVLVQSSVAQSKKFISSWYDCLDIPHTGI